MSQHSSKYVQTDSENQSININGKIFGILMVITQIIVCFMYGFYVNNDPKVTFTNFSATTTFLPFFYLMLTIVGFGLMFSYLKHLIWSGLGFNLLITALCIQIFPLLNAFWQKVGLFTDNTDNFSESKQMIGLFLHDGVIDSAAIVVTHSDSITNAILCGLAICIGFSCIIGRAGQLQAYIMTIFGIIGYDLSRRLISQFGFDAFGTVQVFIFGGFLGLGAALILQIRQKNSKSTSRHPNYTASKFSSQIALFGTLIVFVMLPIAGSEFDSRVNTVNSQSFQYAQLNILQGLFASTIASIIGSLLINGRLAIRDVIYGPIAGGIAVGSASFFITNPAYSLALGFFCGSAQVIGQSIIQRAYLVNSGPVISSTSFILFGIQGIIGSAFAAGFHAIILTNQDQQVFNLSGIPQPIFHLVIGLLSAAMGLGFGLLIGLILVLVNGHDSSDYFTDNTYWVSDDGICMTQSVPKSIVIESSNESVSVHEGQQIKNNHAYL